MASRHSIPPFPSDINRDNFGHWLSGFTDGEGCFFLGTKPKPAAVYAIALRSDDLEILKLIQSFFQCGHIRIRKADPHVENSNPSAAFSIANFVPLSKIIVPHFEKFPLMAKKARDFAIWKNGVQVFSRVAVRENPKSRVAYNWTEEEISCFAKLVADLRKQRIFNSEEIKDFCFQLPECPLFDCL